MIETDASAHLQSDLSLNFQRSERSIPANSRTWLGNVLKVDVLGWKVFFAGYLTGNIAHNEGSPTITEFIGLHK